MTETPRMKLDEVGEATANLLRSTAEELWDISTTILATGRVCADEWEQARTALSHALGTLRLPLSNTSLAEYMAARRK